MKDVCVNCGMSRGGVYRYFDSTADIMKAIIEEEQLTANQNASYDISAGKSAEQLFDEFAAFLIKSLQTLNGSIHLAELEYAKTGEKAAEVLNSRMNIAEARLECIISKGQQEGIFVEGNSGDLARLMVTFIAGIRAEHVIVGHNKGEFYSAQMSTIKKLLMKRG